MRGFAAAAGRRLACFVGRQGDREGSNETGPAPQVSIRV